MSPRRSEDLRSSSSERDPMLRTVCLAYGSCTKLPACPSSSLYGLVRANRLIASTSPCCASTSAIDDFLRHQLSPNRAAKSFEDLQRCHLPIPRYALGESPNWMRVSRILAIELDAACVAYQYCFEVHSDPCSAITLGQVAERFCCKVHPWIRLRMLERRPELKSSSPYPIMLSHRVLLSVGSSAPATMLLRIS